MAFRFAAVCRSSTVRCPTLLPASAAVRAIAPVTTAACSSRFSSLTFGSLSRSPVFGHLASSRRWYSGTNDEADEDDEGEDAEPGGLTEEQKKALNERKQKKKQEKKEKAKALKAQRKAMIEKRAAALGVKPKAPKPKQASSNKEGTTAAEEKAEKAKEEAEEELEHHAISDEELAALQDPERPAKRTELLRVRKAQPVEILVDAEELREAPPVPPHIARIIARNQQAARVGGGGSPPSSGQGS